MKKALFAAAVLGILTTICVSAAMAQAPATTPRKKRVAIFDFDYATGDSGVPGNFGQ